MRFFMLGFSSFLALCLAGCGDSQSSESGLSEPLRVQGAQFFEGSFPEGHASGPVISQINIRSTDLLQGAPSKSVTGLAGPGSESVAIALQGLGHGYWVLPVGAESLESPGSFSWGASLNLSMDVPLGEQFLQTAAYGPNGEFGPETTQRLTVKSRLPTGKVVASLTWGVDADLDFHLIGPSGKELSPKHPNSSELDDSGNAVEGNGLLDHDSLAGCVPDGMRTENVVWTDAPEAGTYQVLVHMFSACGKPAASFKFNLYVDGQSVLEKAGRLLDIDADGGAGNGLFVTEFSCDEGTGTCS
ncbi:MAG TPA: hypothetical protein VER96_31205 [Polyangiaceae bacterium]|nr:hypothetical protein [Polyangiaceae bacterium]